MHVWVVPLDDPDKKRRRELAHLAQARVLASYLAVTPAALAIDRVPGGKPHLRDLALEFNLSHWDRLALLAVSHELPVGVDVQGPHPTASKPWFAKRICTPREHEWFAQDPVPERLLRLWARKEAVIKARGEGSYVDAGGVDVLDDEVDGGWLCRDLELTEAPDCHAAVVVRDEPGVTIALHRFTWDR